MSGAASSKRAEYALKTHRALDDHLPLPTRATCKKSKIWCLKIIDSKLKTSLLMLEYHLAQPKPFRRMFCVNRVKCQNQDNETCHTALVIHEFFAKNLTDIIPHLPYSVDLALCDFWLFCELKWVNSRKYGSQRDLGFESRTGSKPNLKEKFTNRKLATKHQI